MTLEGEYEPSPWDWVRDQVETYERTGGREANTFMDTGLPIIILTTRGNKTGKVRKTPLMRVEHDGEYALVASVGGAPKHPVWYFNVVADPEGAVVQDGPEPFAVSIHEATGTERDEWWVRAVAAYPPYAEYQERTERRIPVFIAPEEVMQAILNALAEQHTELDALLSPLDDKGWARPTRCEGWDVADVVLHLAQTDELAIASAEQRVTEALGALGGPEQENTVDQGAADLVALQRGEPHAALRLRWRDGAALLRAVLGTSDPHQRVQWVAGTLSIHTLCATRLSECWIHTGDVAGALDIEPEVSDRLEHVARLAWRTLPYAFARAGRELTGPVEFDLRAPSGAQWHFVPDGEPVTRVEGDGAELCMVAARRVEPADTSLRPTGPDADAVLELVRTYA